MAGIRCRGKGEEGDDHEMEGERKMEVYVCGDGEKESVIGDVERRERFGGEQRERFGGG